MSEMRMGLNLIKRTMLGKRQIQSRGFSLIELMIVVVIIGILASIAMPQMNQWMAKAKRSEAKTNLSAIYSAEKTFFVEYGTYFADFNNIGYKPEGQLTYRVGFGTNGGIACPATYTGGGTAAGAQAGAINSKAFNCTSCPVMAKGCCEKKEAVGLEGNPTYTILGANQFKAGASADLANNPKYDYLGITQDKVLTLDQDAVFQ